MIKRRNVKIVRTEVQKIRLEQSDIVALLRSTGEIPAGVERTCRVFFQVPTGGDYSGLQIDTDMDNPVHVEWTVVSTEEESDGGK